MRGSASKASAALGGGALSSRVAALGSVLGGVTGLAICAIWGARGRDVRAPAHEQAGARGDHELLRGVEGGCHAGEGRQGQQLGEWHTRRDGLRNAIDDARSLEDLSLVQQTIPVLLAAARQASAELRADKSLAEELLLAWYKQTAKNDREAGRDVNPVDHANAGAPPA